MVDALYVSGKADSDARINLLNGPKTIFMGQVVFNCEDRVK